MSFQEKKVVVNIFSAILIAGLYYWYVFTHYPTEGMETTELAAFWGMTILVLMPVSIVSKIVIHILFGIGNAIVTSENPDYSEDERDKLIELKSTRVSMYIFGAGFLVAMAAIAFEQPLSIMFVLLICGGVASEVFGGVSKLYFYRKGI